MLASNSVRSRSILFSRSMDMFSPGGCHRSRTRRTWTGSSERGALGVAQSCKLPWAGTGIIVVGVDYSEVSRLALREALTLASERAGSELHVVHVETASPLSPGRGASKEVFAESLLGHAAGTASFAEASQRLELS